MDNTQEIRNLIDPKIVLHENPQEKELNNKGKQGRENYPAASNGVLNLNSVIKDLKQKM